jgi:hypothetical protein
MPAAAAASSSSMPTAMPAAASDQQQMQQVVAHAPSAPSAIGVEYTLTKERAEHLAREARIRCPEYLSEEVSRKYPTIAEMFGNDLGILELKAVVDELYLVNNSVTLSMLDDSGNWALQRHRWNERGDAGSIASRKKTVENIGVLDSREPPYFIRNADNPAHADLLTCATLYADGAKAAYQSDVKKKNRTVQISVSIPVKACKEYHRMMPKVVAVWLIDYGNITNDENTKTTWMEVYRSTKDAKAGFHRHKHQMKWVGTMTQQKLQDKELEYIQGQWPGRWDFYPHYEVCQSFYSLAPKVSRPHSHT